MIKLPFGLVAALLLAVQSASAALIPLNLGLSEPPGRGKSAVELVKYKLEPGPAAQPPQAPPNLTDAQLDAVVAFLVPDPRNPPANLTPALVYRVIDVLTKVDMHYKTPITQADWDARLKAMRDEFVAAHGAPGSKAMSAEQWEKAVDGMLSGFVEKLGDPHSVYMNREQAKRFGEQMSGTFVGVGATVEKVADGIKLTTVFPGSGAEKAGLVAGDVVTHINGDPIKDMSVDDAVKRLRGAAGTEVGIKVQRLPKPVQVTRAAIRQPELFSKMAAPGVGYVYFASFGQKIDEKVFAAIDALKAKGATKLVLDVRGNPGGLLHMAQSIASEFLLDKDVINTTKRQGKLAQRAVTDGPGRYRGMKLAVLVNRGSASASEVISAALQEHKAAAIVGSTTYGKGSFQLPMAVEIPVIVPPGFVVGSRGDGTALKLTEGGWYTPRDRSVEGVHDPATGMNKPGSGGVIPDESVTLTEAEELEVMKDLNAQLYGRPSTGAPDAALAKALEVLAR